jgi:hypothetical protein
MYMSFGEFCILFRLEPGPEAFRFWLISHDLPPILIERVIAKAKEKKRLDK